MKKLYKNSLIVLGSLIAVILLNSCKGNTNWGIDHGGLPQCSADSRDSSSAMKIETGSVLKPLTSDTTLRVWHYENGDKLVCVMTGEASMILEAEEVN